MRVRGFDAFERELAEIEERLVERGRVAVAAQLRVFFADPLAVVLQADHVLGEDAVHGCVDARRRVALDGVHEVVGHHFARAGVLEVRGRVLAAHLVGGHRVVAVLAAVGACKGRMRRVPHAA